jgi:hypothetical protein
MTSIVTHKDPETRLKCGYVREDGMLFWAYNPTSKNGESWIDQETFNERTQRIWDRRRVNRDVINERRRKNVASNPQATKDRVRRYRAANADRIREYEKNYRARNISKIRETKKKWNLLNRDTVLGRWLNRRYGISLEEYQVLLRNQGGVCAICGTSKCSTGQRLAVDHDHNTGAVRGVLCKNCNVGLGSFKDDPERLLNAADYLTQRSSK